MTKVEVLLSLSHSSGDRLVHSGPAAHPGILSIYNVYLLVYDPIAN